MACGGDPGKCSSLDDPRIRWQEKRSAGDTPWGGERPSSCGRAVRRCLPPTHVAPRTLADRLATGLSPSPTATAAVGRIQTHKTAGWSATMFSFMPMTREVPWDDVGRVSRAHRAGGTHTYRRRGPKLWFRPHSGCQASRDRRTHHRTTGPWDRWAGPRAPPPSPPLPWGPMGSTYGVVRGAYHTFNFLPGGLPSGQGAGWGGGGGDERHGKTPVWDASLFFGAPLQKNNNAHTTHNTTTSLKNKEK